MCFSCKNELYRPFRIINNPGQPLRVTEQKIGPLIGGKSPGKTYGEYLTAQAFLNLHDDPGIFQPFDSSPLNPGLDMQYHLIPQAVAKIPYFLVIHVVDFLPPIQIRLIFQKIISKILPVQITPFRGSPCRKMDTVGDISYMQFIRVITFPEILEHMLGHFPVQTAYSIDFLGQVNCQVTHGELFMVVFRMQASEPNELLPGNVQPVRIMGHIHSYQSFIKTIMPSRNRGMCGVEC